MTFQYFVYHVIFVINDSLDIMLLGHKLRNIEVITIHTNLQESISQLSWLFVDASLANCFKAVILVLMIVDILKCWHAKDYWKSA